MLHGCRIVPKCNKNINIKILEMMVEKLNESYKIKVIGTIRGWCIGQTREILL